MDWQNAAVLAAVGVSIVYLIKDFVKTSAAETKCGGCGTCEKSSEPPIVTLNLDAPRPPRG